MYLTYLAELYELVNCMYFYYAPGQQLDTFWKMSLGDFAELHVCIKQWLLYKHKFKKIVKYICTWHMRHILVIMGRYHLLVNSKNNSMTHKSIGKIMIIIFAIDL